MNLEIITRCTRQDNLLKIKDSIFGNSTKWSIKWHIVFDTSVVSSVDSTILENLEESNIYKYFFKGTPGDFGHGLINKILDAIPDSSWVYVLDDDNILHENFLYRTSKLTENGFNGIIFSQFVGGKDFSGLQYREAIKENICVSKIDMAQFLMRKSLIGKHRIIPGVYVADGIFIEKIFKENEREFLLVNEILCYYNYFQKTDIKPYTLPRIVLSGVNVDEIKSAKYASYESNELYLANPKKDELIKSISEHDPDAIITVGNSFMDFKELCNLPYNFSRRWLHLNDLNNVGEKAYQCAMNHILENDNSRLVSIFTPTYNTKDKLIRTYQSIIEQTYPNWEWVIVNDSTDNETGKIAQHIAENDPRVKVYEFKSKSKGIIGEAKFRACALSNGEYLFELDHDDRLLPHTLQTMIDAFNKYPDAGFCYCDCIEINEAYGSLTYGNNFAFGYGSYREEEHLGKLFKVSNGPNINPLTIRHIVGAPNHFRAWKRDVYFSVGGHNRRLSIADDYELIVRTFLKTKMVRVKYGSYMQFYHDSNSQNSTRADIQRRVRSISDFYNKRIKNRFNELGKNDWAFDFSGHPLNCPPKFGDEENYVNYIYEI